MTSILYIGNNNQAKKVKKFYIGVNGEAKKVKRGYIGVGGQAKLFYKSSVLPDEYQGVEYIFNENGTQYIDVNIYPDSNTTIFMDYILTRYLASRGDYFFGCSIRGYEGSYQSGSLIYYGYGLGYYTASSGRNTMGEFGKTPDWTTITNSDYIPTANTRTTLLFNAPGGKFYKDDVLIDTIEKTFSNTNLYYNSGKTVKPKLYLFANQYNTNGVAPSINIARESLKLCKFSVWQNNVLVRDMYPCYHKTNNTIGMYDIINNVFYTNAGSGIFTKGPDADI